MKVKLNGYNLLRLTILAEGDTIVEKGEDIFLDESVEGVVPDVAMQVLGYTPQPEEEFFMITKRFSDGWSNQTYISFPLPTLMDNNLGYVFESGRVGRYIPENPINPFNDVFKTLENLFNEMNYKGFVSVKVSRNMNLIGVLFGAGLALYSILEGSKEKVSTFMSKGEHVLESWSASLVISRYPFPFELKSKRLFLTLTNSAMKHLWFYDLNTFKKSSYTDETKVCVVTAWATSLNEMSKRIYRTCQGLDISQKQYRTDITNYVTSTWIDFVAATSKEQ